MHSTLGLVQTVSPNPVYGISRLADWFLKVCSYIVTTATHADRLVMSGHTNTIWSLAKKTADRPVLKDQIFETNPICKPPSLQCLVTFIYHDPELHVCHAVKSIQAILLSPILVCLSTYFQAQCRENTETKACYKDWTWSLAILNVDCQSRRLDSD